MGILEIGLTIWAWYRGWKTWALLPVGIGLCLSIFLVMVLYDTSVFKIYAPSVWGFIFIDTTVIATLVFMIVKARRNSNIDRVISGDSYLKAAFGRYQREAEKSIVSNKSVTVSLPPVRAKLILPNNTDITINGAIRTVGRNDFDRQIPSTALRYISRQHFWIRSDKGKYFIEDYQSANGTKLNGVDIRGKGLHPLNDEDRIDIAGLIVIVFRILF